MVRSMNIVPVSGKTIIRIIVATLSVGALDPSTLTCIKVGASQLDR